MGYKVLGYSLGNEALLYIRTASISGLAALATQKMDLPAVSFALTVLGILSSSQAAIHVGEDNLWSLRAVKAVDTLGVGLYLGGIIAKPA